MHGREPSRQVPAGREPPHPHLVRRDPQLRRMAPHIPHRPRAIQHRRRKVILRPQPVLQHKRIHPALAQPPSHRRPLLIHHQRPDTPRPASQSRPSADSSSRFVPSPRPSPDTRTAEARRYRPSPSAPGAPSGQRITTRSCPGGSLGCFGVNTGGSEVCASPPTESSAIMAIRRTRRVIVVSIRHRFGCLRPGSSAPACLLPISFQARELVLLAVSLHLL